MIFQRSTSSVARAAFMAAMLAGSLGLRADNDAKGLEFFEKEVRPILVEHCYDCHSAESKNLKGGLRLDSQEGLLKGGDLGPALVPGDPDKSRLIEAIRYKNRELQMPPKRALSTAQVEALTKWVAMGAPDPRKASMETAAKPLGMSVEEGRNFWAFKPVSHPPVPEIKKPKAKIENPIDAFHQARLSEAGIAPAPPAGKRTLIRRATYDLIGLPPTQKEVEAFLADDSPEAFGRVIDRLLRLPHYGVRWGRHWLDVARYADSNGRDENLAFGNAWRYRDYVVESFNDDKPFDRFLIEQIAGDLLPNADQETRTATGFLQLGAKVLAEGDKEKLVMDTIDEQIDTMGKAFLGLALGCARCHTHKFDPIMHDDYYGLAAIFKSSKTFADGGRGAIKYWYEHDFASEEEKAKIKAVEKEIAKFKAAATGFKSKETARIRTVARTKSVDYLVAATKFGPRATLEEVAMIAQPKDLHPRILHHCRLHLEYNKTDPVFAKWHQLKGDADAIEGHYSTLFKETEAAFAEARKKDPKAKKIGDERLDPVRAAMNQASGLLAVPTKAAHAFDAKALAEYERLDEIARVFESAAADLSSAMGVADGEILKELPIHIRGSHLNLGKPIARNFPEVMRIGHGGVKMPEKQSGRLELAQWMADPRHPLTARVFVNRTWRWHFGRGIVGTTDNFGARGDRPTHPELLDWLASEFVKSGWSVKQLHRQIMTSSAYRMASAHPESQMANAADPSNLLWWKFEIRRLEAEEIRDSTLAVAGLLDQRLGGKTIPLRNRQFFFNHTSEDHTQYDMLRRRSLYIPIVRNNLCDIFEQFDFPDPNLPSGNRHETVVAPQALLMMNSSLVMNAADALADQLLAAEVDSEAKRVALAYQRILARPPTTAERDRAVKFIGELAGAPSLLNASTVDEAATAVDRKRAWSLFCQSLAASNEFIYLN
jgi:mono/diheme cytochrome c family protein